MLRKSAMFDFLTRLFDTTGFPPRWDCGDWTRGHGWLHILSDLTIWSAYFAIPCILVYFVLRRRDVPFPTIFWLFGAFILACGTTHLMEAIIFWQPVYRLAGVIKLLTAVVSWATVAALVPTIPKALALRTPDELEREVAARKQAEHALQQANAELETRVQDRTAELAEANASLRYEREMLRITLASIGDAVVVTDTEGRVTFLNSMAQTLTGWKDEKAKGQPLETVFRIINEQTRQTVENPAVRALREGTIVGLANHTILIAKDGAERAIDDSAAPIRHEKRNVAGVVLVFRDVTEQRKAQRSARFLASIVESSDDAIIGKDPNGIITSWNLAAERLFGYSAAEAIGSPIAVLAPPDRADEMPAILARLKQGERIEHFDTVRRAKDGRLVPISLTVSPINDEHGEIVGASKIARNISERKRAEEALREERERLRATLTGIGDAVIVTNGESRITMLNPVAQALTGWKEEAVGRPLEEVFRIINEQTRQKVENPVSRVIRENGIVGLANHTILLAKDGREVPIDDSGAPVRNSAGEVVAVVLVFRDIAARRRAERDREERAAELAVALGKRTEEARRAEKAERLLREVDRRKDEFLATLAHELRNPLAPLRNALELMLRADDNKTLIEQARGMMERQVVQMVRLVDDLLDISRITRGVLQIRKERVELVDVLNLAIETARPLIEASAQELTVTMPPQTVSVQADATRLAQVFANLLNNAAKYSDKGGHIWLTAERRGDEAVVSVRDTGIGIAAEHLPHLFKMFSQVDPALERSQGGLGIGLSLVKGLVELHGGTIEAHSGGHRKGSEFTVRLPIVDAPLEIPRGLGRDSGKAGSAGKCRILVVDDLRDTADSLAMILQTMGHDTRTAYDGVEAVQTAATFQPNIILLDIGLPKMNGYEAARQIRNEPWGADVTLVALTGWGQEEDKRRSLDAGFDHHLTKPVEASALEKLLAIINPLREH
jgi:PAS domain S-box-containing protein